MDLSAGKKTRWWICVALALGTFCIYGQVYGFGFISLDDPDYVSGNPVVARGLTLSGVLWAFTHFYASNWHPVTWLSHMLDCQVFGMNPGGPHVVNVLFHAANAVLLFLLLQRLTGAQWRSAIVAGLFAFHPLHVESVAWISERKDVLSTFFGLLSVLCYVAWVRGAAAAPRLNAKKIGAVTLFALSLMAKPMLVTLPFLMLLLDVWPLARVENNGWRTFFTRSFGRLAKEKWPWFLLVAVSCGVTLCAQSTALAATGRFPFSSRLINAVESYFWYVEKTFWPADLAAFYPMRQVQPLGPFALIFAGLLAVSIFSVVQFKRRPFLFVGWYWFVGTLVPVIGLVQVGSQGMADRYSYFPLIGLCIAAVWSAHGVVSRSTTRIKLGAAIAGVGLATLMVAASLQVRYWQSTFTLFRHAVAVTESNDTALTILGASLYHLHRDDEALRALQMAAEINPRAGEMRKYIGLVLARNGKADAALEQYKESVRCEPGNAALQNFLAEALAAGGSHEEALGHFSEAARLQPGNAQYQNDFAVGLVAVGKRAEALEYYQRAVWAEPEGARYQNNFATALFRAGDLDSAMAHYQAAIAADPTFAEAYSNLGVLFFFRQQYEQASAQYAAAIRANPTNAGTHFNAGRTFLRMRKVPEAMREFAEAGRLRPDWADPLNAQAWVLATTDSEPLRNGAEAVTFAEKSVALTARQQPLMLNTLAAAYAEAGRFDEALNTANEALTLSQRANQTNLIQRIQRTITLFQSHTPLRDSTGL